MPDNQFDFWQRKVRGQPAEHVRGRAESGYWRYRLRGMVVGIHLWRDAAGSLFMADDYGVVTPIRDEEFFCEITFQYCIRHPLSSDEWREYRLLHKFTEESLERFDKEDREHRRKNRVR